MLLFAITKVLWLMAMGALIAQDFWREEDESFSLAP
jgi:hypothetical protein